jgi:hypothetical protein
MRFLLLSRSRTNASAGNEDERERKIREGVVKVVMRERTGRRKPCLVEVCKAEMGDLMQ